MALSRPQEHPSDLEPEEAGPSMFSPKVVGNKVPPVKLCCLGLRGDIRSFSARVTCEAA